MPDLSTSQRALQQYVLGGDRQVSDLIAPGRLDNAERRLAIYHDAYRLRLVEALVTDFEGLAAALGFEGFRTASLAYVEATPSRFRNVRWYGGGFPDFLATTAPWSARPELAEVARFEWTLTLAFDASDAPALGFADVATLPPEAWSDLRLRFHPSLHTLTLRSNAPAFRMAVDAGGATPALESAAPVEWAVWRKAGSVHFRSQQPEERYALAAARSGEGFAALCEGLAGFASPDSAPALAASLLRTWVEDELVTGVVAGGSWRETMLPPAPFAGSAPR